LIIIAENIKEISEKEQEEVLCSWEETFNSLWTKWGKVRAGRHLNGEEWYKTYLLLHDSFQYSRRLALEKEKNLKNLLKKEKKLILILDLDNTVLHTTTLRRYAVGPNYTGHLFKGKDMYQIALKGNGETFYTHSKFRPFLKQFIKMVDPYFKIYIYTMGNRSYAHSITNFLQKEVENFEIPKSRIISRDDGKDHTDGKLIKTLRQISPSDDSFYVILDDREDVWSESKRNLWKVYPYIYFPSMNEEFALTRYPEYFKTFTREDIDPFLLFYGQFLQEVHHEYYKWVDEHKETDGEIDVRDILDKKQSSIFEGINWVYTDVFPENVKHPQFTYEWVESSLRGMNNMEEYKSGETNLVITGLRMKENEVIEKALADNVPIVSIIWVQMSINFRRRLPYDLFKSRSMNRSSDSSNQTTDEAKQKTEDEKKGEAKQNGKLEQPKDNRYVRTIK
jgi:RNA polymerase II C-terminal domain phosphatase-like 3/4